VFCVREEWNESCHVLEVWVNMSVKWMNQVVQNIVESTLCNNVLSTPMRGRICWMLFIFCILYLLVIGYIFYIRFWLRQYKNFWNRLRFRRVGVKYRRSFLCSLPLPMPKCSFFIFVFAKWCLLSTVMGSRICKIVVTSVYSFKKLHILLCINWRAIQHRTVTSAMTTLLRQTPQRRLHGNAMTRRRTRTERSWQVPETGDGGAAAPTTTGQRRMTRTTNLETPTSTNVDEVALFCTSCLEATAANEAPRANCSSPRCVVVSHGRCKVDPRGISYKYENNTSKCVAN